MSDFPVTTFAEAAPLLRRPFAPEAIKFRLAGSGLILAYIDARVVIERLNAVIPNWSTTFEPYPGGKQIICHLTIDGLTRSDVGTQSSGPNVDPVKGGYSDALKRAAVHFGVGVSVYAIKQIHVSDLPAGSITKNAKGKDEISPKGHEALRKGYRKWTERESTIRDFGEVLSHGDEEGASGDPEAAPEGVGEAVEQPSAELAAAIKDLATFFDAIPDSKKRGKLTKARFEAQLKDAQGSEEKLLTLRQEVEGLVK